MNILTGHCLCGEIQYQIDKVDPIVKTIFSQQ